MFTIYATSGVRSLYSCQYVSHVYQWVQTKRKVFRKNWDERNDSLMWLYHRESLVPCSMRWNQLAYATDRLVSGQLSITYRLSICLLSSKLLSERVMLPGDWLIGFRRFYGVISLLSTAALPARESVTSSPKNQRNKWSSSTQNTRRCHFGTERVLFVSTSKWSLRQSLVLLFVGKHGFNRHRLDVVKIVSGWWKVIISKSNPWPQPIFRMSSKGCLRNICFSMVNLQPSRHWKSRMENLLVEPYVITQLRLFFP